MKPKTKHLLGSIGIALAVLVFPMTLFALVFSIAWSQ